MSITQKQGVIYILTNPSFPEYVKIGYADDVEKRLKQLNQSEAIPYAFRIYGVYETPARLMDIELHKLIDKLNPELRAIETFDGKPRAKEFYAMSAEDAYGLLECIAKISGTEDKLRRLTPEGHEVQDEEIAEEVREFTRRPNFRFSEYGIPVGSELVYLEDETVKATVYDDRKVKYGDEILSLSALATRLTGRAYGVQGPLWFTYNGEKLTDLRERLEMTER